MKITQLSNKFQFQSLLQHHWRWIFVTLLIALMTAAYIMFYAAEMMEVDIIDKHGLPQEAEKIKISSSSASSFTSSSLPLISVKRIHASPFQDHLLAQLLLDDIELSVHSGQKLNDHLFIKSIDERGVNILYDQQLHRYDLKPPSIAVTNNLHNDKHGSNLLTESIKVLSHEFRRTSAGLEVYSATEQGLSANLGLHNGDQIHKINGEPVRDPEDIPRILKNYHPKQVLEFVGSRQGQSTNWVYQAQADD